MKPKAAATNEYVEAQMETTEITLFLDSNPLLHYPPIKNVDWRTVCGGSAVRLVLCLQVIHELDEKKDDPRLGDRASRTIKEIKAIRSAGGIVCDGVILDVFNYEVRAADFPATLSYDSKDDRIVHSIKKYAETNPCASIAVYTEDMGMGLRCEAHGLTVISPDPASRLENPQTEHDKKYKLAITELNDLKNRIPVLEVVISSAEARAPEKQQMTFSLSTNLVQRDLDADFENHQKVLGLFPMQNKEITSGRILPSLPDNNDAIARYNEKLEQYFKKYRKWLEKRELLEIISAHQITLSVWIVNSGSVPADDLDLTIEVGDPVALLCEASSEKAKSLELPEPPKPPKKPSSGSFPRFDELLLPPAYTLPNIGQQWNRKATVEKQEDTNTFHIEFSTKRLKHNEYEQVANLILVLRPNAIHPFQMRYRITAANVIKVIEGDISIIVNVNAKEGS